ncbi:hypothetical protein [Bacillus sp. FDAARGOS_1420]|uniref:hypothetical protein n=1 Tax=Bacillus sp. FDAARGOS_1420 TaxID=2856338 RepID=UPI001C5AF133|nr:hypothetical protein [Bacillus sp. FDAARGOS_1420]MBW3496885.1 hypothetical protein [Bacillus sp. FDAARGOS_1420]MBW3496898.1 hypothetical protein [Bacillus sp. FDAARGOS_1420]
MPSIDQILQALPKDTSAVNYKTNLTAVEKVIPNIVKDINQGTINNIAKAIAVYGASLIPYGGVLISPLISLLWPELGGSKTLQQMRKEITDEINTKITDTFQKYDESTIKKQIIPLFEELQKFEKLINETVGVKYDSIHNVTYSDISSDIRSPGDYYAGTVDETVPVVARTIDSQFNTIISNCMKAPDSTNLLADIDIWELPIYVILAIAHLQFLYFMTVNGKGDKIQLDEHNWKIYYSYPLDKKNREYRDYIENTYKKGLQQFEFKMNNICTNGKNDYKRLIFLNSQINYYSTFQAHISVNQNVVNRWKNKLEQYENLIKERNKYLALTINTTALNLSLPGRWITEEDRYYYLDNNDCRKYRWLNDQNHYYYFNPEKYGKMQTGWYIDVNQKWYYFNPYPQNYNHNLYLAVGEMFHSGHYIIDNHGYHFNNSGICGNPYTAQLELSKTIYSGTYKLVDPQKNNLVLGVNYNKTYDISNNIVAFLTRDNQDMSQEWEFIFESDKNAYQIINKKNSHLVLSWDKTEEQYNKNIIVAPNKNKDEQYWILIGIQNECRIINYAEQNKKMGITTTGYSEVYIGVIPGNITRAFTLEK